MDRRVLLAQWNLPQDFCVVVGRHHDPPLGWLLNRSRLWPVKWRTSSAVPWGRRLGGWSSKALRALLPRATEERFPAEPESLREIINRAIGEGDPAPDVPSLDDRPGQPTPPAGSSEMFSASRSDPLRHDFTITLITALAFAVVLFGCRWFLRF